MWSHQVAPGVSAAEPLIRRLFLLHPTYPTILLELTNTTDTIVTSAGKSSITMCSLTRRGWIVIIFCSGVLNVNAFLSCISVDVEEKGVRVDAIINTYIFFLSVSYQERQKDATYITVSSRPKPDSEPSTRIVKSMSLKAAIAKGKIVRLSESSKPGEPAKPGDFEINKFFRRLSFKQQVRSVTDK